jgi:hypothetical protein
VPFGHNQQYLKSEKVTKLEKQPQNKPTKPHDFTFKHHPEQPSNQRILKHPR